MKEGVRCGGCSIPVSWINPTEDIDIVNPTGSRYFDRIRMFSVQTTLGTRPGLGNKLVTTFPVTSD